jgi:hypothetical protein
VAASWTERGAANVAQSDGKNKTIVVVSHEDVTTLPRWRTAALVALSVLAVALAVRLAGPGTIPPFDDLYHLHRISWSAAHPGHVLELDPDRGIGGAWCPWPPLYDLFMGTAGRIVGVGITVWIAPLLFSLFAALLALVVTRRYGPLSGLTAGGGMALAPYLVAVSRRGALDHHWAEPILVAAILAAASASRRGRRPRLAAGGLALAITGALMVQTALLVAAALAFATVFLSESRPFSLWEKVPEGRMRAAPPAFAFALSALAIVCWRLTRPPGYPSNVWFLGWPHAAALGAAAVAMAILALGRSRIVALLVGGACILPFVPQLLAGARFFGGDPWLTTIVEFQPMLRDPERLGTDLANLGSVGAIILAFIAAVRRRRPAPVPFASSFFAAAYLLLALTSRRFLVPGLAPFILAAALAARDRAGTRRLRLAVLLLTLLPALSFDLWSLRDREPEPAWITAPRMLAREVVPLPRGRILAPWSIGHALHVLGRQPVVLDNFGSMPDEMAFGDATDALLQTHPEALAGWCRRHGVRYLVLPAAGLRAAAASIGLDPALYTGTPLAAQTVWSRLRRGDRLAGFSRRSANVWEVDGGIENAKWKELRERHDTFSISDFFAPGTNAYDGAP